MRIAVDVMGGDHGCGVMVRGVRDGLQADSRITEVHLVGIESEVRAALAAEKLQDSRVRILHASEVLTMEDKPVEGLRKKRQCSILKAVELVRDGLADAVISPGNTGGMVAASTIRLRTLPGVDRPAIATIIPSSEREFVLVDSGANPDCKPQHLLQFAIMGSVYSQTVLGREKPRVGILSNGSEEIKGTELTREALKLCQDAPIHFVGYVEGHDLFADRVEVVVTDGFVGNIVLKTCESMGKAVLSLLRRELSASPIRKLGVLLARAGFRNIKRRMDPEAYGGAPLLGLNGSVIKVHGSAGPKAVMNALRQAADAVSQGVNHRIVQELASYHNAHPETPKL